MDAAMLGWVIPVATLAGGGMAWASTQIWQRRQHKSKEKADAWQRLKDGREWLEERISEEQDPNRKQKYRSQLKEVDEAYSSDIRETCQFFRRER